MSAPIPQAAFQDGASERAKVKRRQFSHAENNLIATLYEQGVRPTVIAARMGVSVFTIRGKLWQWGIGGKFRPDMVKERGE